VPNFIYAALAIMVLVSVAAYSKRDLKLLKESN